MRHTTTLLAFLVSLIAMVSASVPASAAQASPYSVKGCVTDSTGTGESYATLRVYALPDTTKAVVVGVTGADGCFDKALGAPGNYRLTVLVLGAAPLVSDFAVTKAAPVADLGNLVTDYSANTLGEVTVTAVKPLIAREIDRIGYDVQADDESKTSTLEEMLRKVPLVSVDPDGTIRINGATGFKVYKNGRPNNSFTQNAKDIFKSIPASTIRKIEVITDPGAREDAEGSGMILNIVTLENTIIKGVMGNATLSYDNNRNVPSPNIWLTSQIDKLTFSLYAGLGGSPSRSGKARYSAERRFDSSGNILRQSGESRSSSIYQNVGLELSYELDTLNLFTAEFSCFGYSSKSRGIYEIEMVDFDGAGIYSYRSRELTDPSRGLWLDGSFNYQRSTRLKGEKITISYQISGNSNKSKSSEEYFDMNDMPVAYTGINSDSRAKLLEQTVQVDWTRPFGQAHTLDVGGKYIHRDNHSISDRDYENQNSVHTDFSHITQVGALFADYRFNYRSFGARAGLRYEYSRLEAKYKDGSQDPFHSSLNDLVPNAAVSYTINPANSMRLSYSSSINRPGINYLNPTVDANPQGQSQGNPDLGSARNHNINFNYSFFSRKLNIDFNTSYYFSNNGIIGVQYAEDDYLYSTYANGGHTRRFYAGLYMQWTATPKTNIMLSPSIQYEYKSNPSLGISVHGWTPSGNLRVTQRLPWGLSLSGMAFYWGRSRDLYSVSEPKGMSALFHNFSLQKSFLRENRLTVRLYANNPFASNKYVSETYVINQPYTNWSRSENYGRRSFGISLSYRFGSLQVQVKKVRGISNDDVVGGASRGQ